MPASNQSRDIEIRMMVRANVLTERVLSAPFGAYEARYYKVEDSAGLLPDTFGGERLTELEEFWVEAKVESDTAVVTASFTGVITSMEDRDKVFYPPLF